MALGLQALARLQRTIWIVRQNVITQFGSIYADIDLLFHLQVVAR